MGTKASPGAFRCYEAALPDEPFFTILARDPAAPATLEFWAAERIRKDKNHTEEDRSRISEAMTERLEMADWRQKNLDPTGDGIPSWKLKRPDDLDDGPRVCVAESRIDALFETTKTFVSPSAEGDGDEAVRVSREWLRQIADRLKFSDPGAAELLRLASHAISPPKESTTYFYDEKTDRNVPLKMLSAVRVSELLDYATCYGEFDENTPSGTMSEYGPQMSSPMNDVRRGAILAYKVVLGMRDEHLAVPDSQDPHALELPAPWRNKADVETIAALQKEIENLKSLPDVAPDELMRKGNPQFIVESMRVGDETIVAVPVDDSYTGRTIEDCKSKFSAEPDFVSTPVSPGEKQPTIDSAPDDLAHAPEVPHHRFSMFHKGEQYAYARGLEINPIHLPTALDAMAKDGWHLLAIFGQTDSQHVGFIFERGIPAGTELRDFSSFEIAHGYGGGFARQKPDPRMDAYEEGVPLDKIGLGRGQEP